MLRQLSADIEATNEMTAGATEEMEELQLRMEIGELTDEEFESEAAAFKGELEQAEAKVAGLQSEVDGLEEALSRWEETAISAGHDPGGEDAPAADDDDDVEVEFDEDSGDDSSDDDSSNDDSDEAGDSDSEAIEVEEAAAEDEEDLFGDDSPAGDMIHSDAVGQVEDLSDVFGGGDASQGAAVPMRRLSRASGPTSSAKVRSAKAANCVSPSSISGIQR